MCFFFFIHTLNINSHKVNKILKKKNELTPSIFDCALAVNKYFYRCSAIISFDSTNKIIFFLSVIIKTILSNNSTHGESENCAEECFPGCLSIH